MELVATLSMFNRVADFVDGGRMSTALSDAGIEAASKALADLPKAKDKRAQVRSAAGHLQLALAATKIGSPARADMRKILRYGGLLRAVDRREYLLCLMAVCYRYLGEDKLYEQTMEDALRTRHVLDDTEFGTDAMGVIAFLNPVNWVDISIASPVRVADVERFQMRLEELPD